MAVVEVAHRRHQADRAALAAQRLERRAQLLLGADDPHRRSLRRRRSCPAIVIVRAASASYSGSSSGARSRSASRCLATVAWSPRAIGPVRASPPRSAQLAALRRTSGAEQLAGLVLVDAGAGEQGRGALLERDRGSSRRSRRPRGRRRGPPRRSRTAACRAPAPAPGRWPSASASAPAIAAGAPASGARSSGTVCSGCREKAAAPAAVQAARASSPVAPLVWPTKRRRGAWAATRSATAAISPSGTQIRAISASGAAGVELVAAGLAHVEAGDSRGRGDRSAYASAPDHHDRRQRHGRRGDVGGDPFQFPHGRYRSVAVWSEKRRRRHGPRLPRRPGWVAAACRAGKYRSVPAY